MPSQAEQKRKHILAAMDYAVPEGERAAAEDLLDIYQDDPIALLLLQEFYSFLPEAREDWIRELRLVSRRRGLFLLMALTRHDKYLYLVSSEGIEFHGRVEDGFFADELIDYFGYDRHEALTAACADIESLPVYEPLCFDADICPACHAASGEYHELGCPVEICPWCGGQLIHCNCRYEQLGLDAISSEEELDRLEALLEQRGRLPYSPEQRPSFAGEGPEVLFE